MELFNIRSKYEMLYNTLSQYDLFTFYNNNKNRTGQIIYQYAMSYRYMYIDPNDKNYIVFDDGENCSCKIEQNSQFLVTPINFGRDHIEIFFENEKIDIFCKKKS